MNHPPLTQGALKGLMSGSAVKSPILQAIKVEEAPSATQMRYKLCLNDGQNMCMAVLATSLNPLVQENKFRPFCVFELRNCQVTIPPGKNMRVLVVSDVDVKATPTRIIGQPTHLGGGPPQGAQPQSPPKPQAQQGGAPQRPFGQAIPPKPSPQRMNQSPYQAAPPRPVGPPQRSPQQQRNNMMPQPIPINALNPYISRWTIKARVTQKSEQKTYTRGNYFSASFLDADGTEIRAAFFADSVDQFFEVIQQGKVYLISNARIKFATKRFRGGCDFEMTVPPTATIVECPDDGTIAMKHYALVPISAIENCAKDAVIDVLGICTHVSPLDTASGKERNLTKLTITLCDATEKSVRITMWSQKALDMQETLTGVEGHVIAAKDMKVYVSPSSPTRPSYVSLTSFPSSEFDIDPTTPEANKLREWWLARNGDTTGIDCISGPEFGAGPSGPLRSNSNDTFSLLTDQLVKDGPQYLTIRGTIVFVRSDLDPWYNACSMDGCNKKVVEENMQWRCTGCGSLNPKCYQRYILSVMARDHSGGCWLTAFDDVGKVLLGIEATELHDLKQADPEQRDFMWYINNSYFKKWNFRIRGIQQEWGGKTSTKFTIMRATPVDPVVESTQLVDRIHKYLALDTKGDVGPTGMEVSQNFA